MTGNGQVQGQVVRPDLDLLATQLRVHIPLVLVAATAWTRMDNITDATNDSGALREVGRRRHTWIVSVRYIGTFGSFIGFGFAFGQGPYWPPRTPGRYPLVRRTPATTSPPPRRRIHGRGPIRPGDWAGRPRIRRSPATVRVPINHPAWSCGMLVLVEGAAQPVSSTDLQTSGMCWFVHRFG